MQLLNFTFLFLLAKLGKYVLPTTLVGRWGKKEKSLSFNQWLKWVELNGPNFETVWEMILLAHADHLIDVMTKIYNYAS